MIYHLSEYLKEIGLDYPGQGLLGYLSFRAIASFCLALLISIFAGRRIIGWLQKKQIGETIRDLGLEGQMQKKGTPTMGGIINAVVIMKTILENQAEAPLLAMVRIVGQVLKGDGKELLAIIEQKVAGQDADGNKVAKPVISGTYQLTVIREAYEIEAIEQGISEITIFVVIEAFINLINQVNNEAYSGVEEVEAVTLENIAEHLEYYNGETYDEYLAGYAEENQDVNNTIY